MKTVRIVIGGLPYFGRMLAELLDGGDWECRYLPSAGRRPGGWATTLAEIARADLIYLVGGQVERWSRPDWLLRCGRRRVVMHWVGTDVSCALDAARRRRLSRRLVRGPQHWAEVPWTAAELRPLGLDCEIVPLAPARLSQVLPPLPPEFSVLTYLPDARPDFYGRPVVLRLAAAFPKVRFLVTGSEGNGWQAPQNMEFLGWQHEMAPVYARGSVLLRLPEHDGLSFMVLEALAAGRHVIWNHPFEGVLSAGDGQEAEMQLRALLDAHRSGTLRLNETGAALVRTHYSRERLRSDLLARFEALVAR